MKLSKEALDIIQIDVALKSSDLATERQKYLDEIKRGRRGGWQTPAMGERIRQDASTIAQYEADLIIAAYKQTGSVLEQSDIDEFIKNLEARIKMAGSVPAGVSPGSAVLLGDAGAGIAQRIRLCMISAMNKMNMERKAEPAVVQPVVIRPDFSFIADIRIHEIVERDYAELQLLNPDLTPKSVLILSGGIIEGLLIDALVSNGTPVEEVHGKFLKDLIYPAKNAGIIQHDNIADSLRIFRNLVHPAREIKDSLSFSKEHANHSKTGVDVIINEVRNWYSKRTP